MSGINIVAKNSAIIGTTRIAARILGLLSTIIVARILTPEDYAVIAACMIAQDLGLRLQEIGIAQNITTKDELNKRFLGTLFYVKLTLGILLTLVIYLTSGFVAEQLDSPDIELVLEALSLVFFLQSLSNVNLTVELRKQNFSPSMKVTLLAKIISVLVTIFSAIVLNNYWALAIGMLVSALSTMSLSYIVSSPFLPKNFSFQEAKEILSFSKWFTFNQLVEFLNAKSGIIVISKFFESKVVGFFTVGLEICMIFSMELTKAIDSANQVYLSERKRALSSLEFKKTITENLANTIIIKSFLLLPIYVTFFFHSDFIIYFLLGEQWLGLAPYFMYFSITCFIAGMSDSFLKPIIIYRIPQKLILVSISVLLSRFFVLYLAVYLNNPLVIAIGGIFIQILRFLFFAAILMFITGVSANTLVKLVLNSVPLIFVFILCNYFFIDFTPYSLLNILISNSVGALLVLLLGKWQSETTLNILYQRAMEQLKHIIEVRK